MKTKEKDAKRNLSVAELQAELSAVREKHFKLRFRHRTMPVTNPMEIRDLRRHMARLQTWIREKAAGQESGGTRARNSGSQAAGQESGGTRLRNSGSQLQVKQ